MSPRTGPACLLLAGLALLPVSARGAEPPAVATPQEYALDAGHSIIEFSIGFAFSRVKGRFTSAKGTILYDSTQTARSSVTIVIDSKSIDTGWPHRDEHLRTSDFFDVEKYPTIVFQSDPLTPSGHDWLMPGKLTMHGVTRPITIGFRFTHPAERSPESNWMILNAEGSVRLARADFGIVGGSTYNSWFDKARAATMAESVDVTLEIEGWRADAQSVRSPPIEGALQRIAANGVQSQIDRLTEIKKTKTPAEFAAYLGGNDLLTRALIGGGRVPDAVRLGRALADLYPAETRAQMVCGAALAVSGDARGAERQYTKAKEVFRPRTPDPNEKFPQDDETWYYLDQLSRTVMEWGFAKQAVPLARAVTELYPGIARAQTTLGLSLATSGDARGASDAYARAIEIDPRETRALEWRRRLPGRTE